MTTRYTHLAPEHKFAAVERLIVRENRVRQLTLKLNPPTLTVLRSMFVLSIKSITMC